MNSILQNNPNLWKFNMQNSQQNTREKKVESYLKARIDERMSVEEFTQFPQYLEIETINTCNARCSMCTIEDWDRPLIRMSDEMFEDIAKQLVPHRHLLKDVSLYKDCEPLIDKKLADRIAYLKLLKINNVGISTNVSLLNEKKAVDILEAGIDKIILSIDSLKKDVFERIRLGLNFEVVMENALRFIELRDKINPETKIRIRMIDLPENAGEWSDYFSFWEPKLGNKDICDMRRYHNWGGQLKRKHAIKQIDFSELPCTSLWTKVVIHADGTIPLCSVDFHKLYPLGDLKTQSIQEIWQASIVEKFRSLHAAGMRGNNKLCLTCNVWDDMDVWKKA